MTMALRAEARERIVLAVPYLAVLAATRLGFVPLPDETNYHLPAVISLAAGLPGLDLESYGVASTPLPGYLLAIWSKVAGQALPALRLLTVAFAYATALLFHDCARRAVPGRALSVTALFVFFPYIFLHSFTIYTLIYGLFFAVLSINLYLRGDALKWKVLSALSLVGAVYCRQNLLAFPAGILLFLVYQVVRGRLGLGRAAVQAAIFSAPALALAPLFVHWGGLAPPRFQEAYGVSLNVKHLGFLPVFVGVYFLPAVGVLRARTERLLWYALATAVAVVLLLALRWFQPWNGASYDLQGLISSVLEAVHGRVPVLAVAGVWTATAAGLLILVRFLFSAEASALTGIALAVIAVLLVTPLVWERYYASLVPVLLLLVWSRYQPARRILTGWVLCQALIGLGYLGAKVLR